MWVRICVSLQKSDSVKLAKRDAVLLFPVPGQKLFGQRGRAGEGETGITSFIIQGGTFAMPVSST